MELLKPVAEGSDSVLKTLWHHSDAVMCCSLKVIIHELYKSCEFFIFFQIISYLDYFRHKIIVVF